MFPWHSPQWQHIRQLLQSRRLPHALLLHGSRGLGKLDFARELAAAVLCRQPDGEQQACGQCPSCQLLQAGTHPDFYLLKPVEKKNTSSKKPALRIRIEDIRSLIDSLNQTSQLGGYRVAVLDQAEQMTLEAANSLLKTLEEPGEQVLLLLLSDRPNRLPVTIRSRCQRLRFHMPDSEAALQWLQSRPEAADFDTQAQQQALRLAYGAPLAALAELQNQAQQELLAQALTAAVQGKNSLDYAGKLAQFDKVKMLEALQGWLVDLTRIASAGADVPITHQHYRKPLQQKAAKASRQRLFRFQDELSKTLNYSAIALNEQLLWENLLISWDSL